MSSQLHHRGLVGRIGIVARFCGAVPTRTGEQWNCARSVSEGDTHE